MTVSRFQREASDLVKRCCWVAVVLILVATRSAEGADLIGSPYFVFVPRSLGVTALQKGLPPIREYSGERVTTLYSVELSGFDVLIRITRNSLTPSLEILSPITISVEASECLEVVPLTDFLSRVVVTNSCSSDEVGSEYVVVRMGSTEKRIDLRTVRVGTVAKSL